MRARPALATTALSARFYRLGYQFERGVVADHPVAGQAPFLRCILQNDVPAPSCNAGDRAGVHAASARFDTERNDLIDTRTGRVGQVQNELFRQDGITRKQGWRFAYISTLMMVDNSGCPTST